MEIELEEYVNVNSNEAKEEVIQEKEVSNSLQEFSVLVSRVAKEDEKKESLVHNDQIEQKNVISP